MLQNSRATLDAIDGKPTDPVGLTSIEAILKASDTLISSNAVAVIRTILQGMKVQNQITRTSLDAVIGLGKIVATDLGN